MVFPSVDNFLKIFNFYQLNSIKSVKNLTKSSFKYNNLEKFFEALNLDYGDGPQGLTYPQHKDEILQAINSRLDLSKYFNGAGFPGSYAFNTSDCFMFKTIMLDWASTIKTFQDSTSQCTNAYKLSSEDVDKAIRGFGIDFINSRTVASLNRRQTFLLNMCDLYKIKGSPQSIIKALNIIGLDDIYITEAWVYPTRDGQQNVEIKWIPVKQPQTFDPETNSYSNPNEGMEVEYWDWGKFTSKIDSILECHWFYKKFEIIDLNWNDPDTYFHLPSLTPYFNIKIKFDNSEQTTLLRIVNGIIDNQIKDYLMGTEPAKELTLETYGKNISFLSAWLGFIYSLVLYADYLRYNELSKFTKKFGFTGLNYDNIVGTNKYLQLIYRVFTFINGLEHPITRKTYLSTLSNYFTVTSVPLGYCSYEEVKYWWLTTPHTQEDTKNGLDSVREIIIPTKCDITEDGQSVEFFWNDKYNYGYYDLEVCFDLNDNYKTWTVIESNSEIRSQSMQRIISITQNGSKISQIDLRNRIRIVHYHTESNIPQIFFEKPFYFGQGNHDTLMDMLYYYNSDIIHDAFYKHGGIYKICNNPSYGIAKSISDKELINNYDKYIDSLQQRNVDRDCQPRTFTNSFLQYPTSIFDVDKDIIKETTFRKYLNDITYNYKDYISHDAEKLNYINISDKYPQNKKWNWGISYGNTTDITYYFINYEGKKWCRIKGDKLFVDNNVSIPYDSFDFGTPFYKDGNVYFYVTTNNTVNNNGSYFTITKDNSCLMEDNWNSLLYTTKTFNKTEKLQNDLDNEYSVQYKINDDKINVEVPPSDIFPNTVIESHTFNDKQFYFSDTIFKPDSKLAKSVVVAKIDLSFCDIVYQQIAKTYESDNVNYNDLINLYIPVYKDPFNENAEVLYKYENFLHYLYINSYVLDYNTGYIYKQFNYYLDEQYNYLYIKCIDLDKHNVSDSIVFKWIRVKVSREWCNEENRLSIYYKIINNKYDTDILDRRIPVLNTGKCGYSLNYKRVYDSARYLQNYVVKNEDYSLLPETVNKVLCINSGQDCTCKVKQDYIDIYGNIKFKYINETSVKSYIYNNETKKSTQLIFNNTLPLIDDVNYGIDQDLFDFINSQIVIYEDDITQYENIILSFADILQDYFKRNNFNINLDVYNSHIFNSRLVRNIVNFYKPKRDRMLSLMSQMELENVDKVLSDISDINYNSIYLNNYQNYKSVKYNKKENGLSNKSRIKQQIDEYVPLSDLVFLKDNINNGEVVNYREVYPFVNKYEPKLEIFDRIDNLNNYKIVEKDSVKYSSFYCSDFNENINGFYFYIVDYPITYTNNNYYFVNKKFTFVSKYDEDGVERPELGYTTIERWFCFEYKYKDDYMYHASYISDKNPGNLPNIDTDGNILKYTKIPENINDYDSCVLYLSKAIYDKGIFQNKTDTNKGFVKVNLRNLEPVFYMGGFDNDKYNGYYYPTGKMRNDQPIYRNGNGKMISHYDLSYLPDTYLNFSIKEYNKSNSKKYWIITDYCQIPDISDATYIAFCDNNYSIFEVVDGISTGKTKSFYKLNPLKDNIMSDILFVCGINGYSMDVISENPQLLTKLDQTYHKKYDMSKEYYDIINRKIFQGDLPVKYEPISYIDFYYDRYLKDNYLYNNNYVTNVEVKDIDRNSIELNKKYYGMDYWYNQYGSLYVNGNFTKVTFKNNKQLTDVGGVFLRIKRVVLKDDSTFIVNDLNWHTYYLKLNNDIIQLFVDGIYTKDLENVDINNIVIENVYCYICEYALFNVNIPDWYLSIINDYGVYTYRKEQSKLYDNKTKNNYTPLFNIETPRNCYGKYVTGLPENIEGDRFSSTLMNYDFTYNLSHYNGSNKYKTYKWNAASYYNPKQTRELSILWSKMTANRIYNRNVILDTDSDGKITGVTIDREYTQNRLKLNKLENIYCEKQRYMLCDGQEFSVPSNYISPYNTYIPIWWNKKPEKYKTGSVQHRPLTISIKEKYDEYYPVVKHGGKKGNYFDYGLDFDGCLTSYCGNPHIFNTSEVDENTGYVSTVGKFKNELIGKQYSTRRIVETIGDTHNYNCGNTESNIFYDPNFSKLTQEMKDNHIYHTELMLDKCKDFPIDISGKYVAKKLDSIYKQEYDFNYCYSNIKNHNTDRINQKINNKNFILNNEIDIYSETIAVLTYNNMCRYYIWEIRNYKHTLSKEKIGNVIKQTQFVDNDGNPYYYCIIKTNIATNYVKCRYIINNPNDRFLNLHDVYNINNYNEVVDVAINYGAINSMYVDRTFDYTNIRKVYEILSKKTLPLFGDVYNEAFNVKAKYFDKNITYRLNKMYYVHNNYDYINQLQLDLCSQKLCKWNNDLQEKLRTNHYVDVKQDIISDRGFRNYSIMTFKRENDDHIEKYTNNENIKTDFYMVNDKLYIRYNSIWYGPYKSKKIKDEVLQNKLNNLCCYIDCLFDGENLYVRTDNCGWVIAEKYTGNYGINNSIYKLFMDDNMNIIINVPYTDISLDDLNYYVDEEKIQATVLRYKKLYNRGHDQLGYFGEELRKDPMDDVYFGKGNRETILDRLYIYVYSICFTDKNEIILEKPESLSILNN